MHSTYLRLGIASVVGLFLLLVGLVGCKDNPVDASSATAQNVGQAALGGEAAAKRVESPFDDAEVYFEKNTTDDDLGLQIFLDAEGWTQLDVSDPANHKIFQIHTQGTLSELGITELRFESAEPSPDEVLALFPPGEYAFSGKTVEGEGLASTAELSHQFVPAFEFSPSDGVVVADLENVTVTWDAPRAELVEIILENEDNDNVFDVTVEGASGSLDVPPQFLDAGIEYKIELLAYHENGNRTIVESTFNTPE